MKPDDWKGLGVSLALHTLLLLIGSTFFLASKFEDPPLRLVEIEFGSFETTSAAARSAPRADRPAPAPNPEPVRETPRVEPQPTPVRPPQVRPTPPTPEPPVARPEPREATPAPPSPPAETPREVSGGGDPQGQQGTNPTGSDANGTATTGSSGVSVAGLGSRGASCPSPRFPGAAGRVVYAVTFSPEGRYVSSRPRTRGGNPSLDAAVRAVIAGCRANPLPAAADQVNQEGTVTFVFSVR